MRRNFGADSRCPRKLRWYKTIFVFTGKDASVDKMRMEQSMKGKILVTGATGVVGREVVKALAKRGQKVLAATRYPEKYASPKLASVEYVHFDFTNDQGSQHLFREVDRLFLATPPLGDEECELAIRLIDQARQQEVKQIVRLSAMGVEENEASHHRAAEKYLEESGVAFTVLRPNFFMQNFLTYYRDCIRKQNMIILPAGKGKTSFVDARDIGEAAVQALTNSGHLNKTYTLTGSQAIDHFEVAEMLSKTLGREIVYIPVADEKMRDFLIDLAWVGEEIDAFIKMYQCVQIGWSAGISPDLEAMLNRPPINFAQFARDCADAWR